MIAGLCIGGQVVRQEQVFKGNRPDAGLDPKEGYTLPIQTCTRNIRSIGRFVSSQASRIALPSEITPFTVTRSVVNWTGGAIGTSIFCLWGMCGEGSTNADRAILAPFLGSLLVGWTVARLLDTNQVLASGKRVFNQLFFSLLFCNAAPIFYSSIKESVQTGSVADQNYAGYLITMVAISYVSLAWSLFTHYADAGSEERNRNSLEWVAPITFLLLTQAFREQWEGII